MMFITAYGQQVEMGRATLVQKKTVPKRSQKRPLIRGIVRLMQLLRRTRSLKDSAQQIAGWLYINTSLIIKVIIPPSNFIPLVVIIIIYHLPTLLDATCYSEDFFGSLLWPIVARMTFPRSCRSWWRCWQPAWRPCWIKRDHGGDLPDMHRVPGNHRIRLERLKSQTCN